MYKELMKIRVRMPSGLSSILQGMYAREAIRKIRERTLSGLDLNGNSFVGYSQSYKESQLFKDLEKDPNKVNLRLWGDMQESMQFQGVEGNSVVIGFDNEEDAAKAHGHQNGSNNLPRRQWFGLSSTEEKELFDKYTLLQSRFDQANIQELLSTRDRGTQEDSGIFIEDFTDAANRNP